jgi:hypothetical protein
MGLFENPNRAACSYLNWLVAMLLPVVLSINCAGLSGGAKLDRLCGKLRHACGSSSMVKEIAWISTAEIAVEPGVPSVIGRIDRKRVDFEQCRCRRIEFYHKTPWCRCRKHSKSALDDRTSASSPVTATVRQPLFVIGDRAPRMVATP